MFLDDYVSHSVEYEADVPGVCGACEVSVYLLFLAFLVERLKSLADVVLCFVVCVGTCCVCVGVGVGVRVCVCGCVGVWVCVKRVYVRSIAVWAKLRTGSMRSNNTAMLCAPT